MGTATAIKRTVVADLVRLSRLAGQSDQAHTAARRAVDLDVGVVHEWLTNRAGSERCVEALTEAFPEHHIYTSLLDRAEFPGLVERTSTSGLGRVVPHRHGHLIAGPALPLAMRRLRLSTEHDLVIYSFHHFATWTRAPAGTPAIVYCYTPPRFIYRSETMGRERGVLRAAKHVRRVAGSFDLRNLERTRATLVAISTSVARRVRDVYGQDPIVVHPPVDVDRFAQAAGTEPQDYFVLCGRLVDYKRPDVAIEAFRGLDAQLLVVGSGRRERALRRMAPPNVKFLGHVTDAKYTAVVRGARALVFPAEEDFGLVAVEALAAGVPVVALAAGGALDYMQHGVNGVLVDRQDPVAFAQAIIQVDQVLLDRSVIAATALRFSKKQFIERMRSLALEVAAG